jgi:hypothetical protein
MKSVSVYQDLKVVLATIFQSLGGQIWNHRTLQILESSSRQPCFNFPSISGCIRNFRILQTWRSYHFIAGEEILVSFSDFWDTVCIKTYSNGMGVTSGAGTAYPTASPEFILGF